MALSPSQSCWGPPRSLHCQPNQQEERKPAWKATADGQRGDSVCWFPTDTFLGMPAAGGQPSVLESHVGHLRPLAPGIQCDPAGTDPKGDTWGAGWQQASCPEQEACCTV